MARNNKKYIEYILTPGGNQATPVTGSLSTTGNSINLADKQIGVLVASDPANATGLVKGNFLPASTSAKDVDAIKLVLGTPYSSNTSLVDGWDITKGHDETCVIRRDRVQSFTARISKLGTFSSQVSTTFAVPQDLVSYNVFMEARSVRNDFTYGRVVDTFTESVTTPDYTSQPLYTQPLSHLLQNLVSNINLQSNVLSTSPAYMSRGNKSVIAFGVNIAGGAGVTLGSITCGTSIPVLQSPSLTNSYVANEEFVETVLGWIATSTLTAASTIELVDLSDAGLVGGVDVDALVIMGTDDAMALAHDDTYSTKVDVRVELGGGFLTDLPKPTKVKGSDAFDGYGAGRQWRIRYDERAFGQRYSAQLTGHRDEFIVIPNGIDETKSYYARIIDVEDTDYRMVTNHINQKRIVILFEAAVACDTVTNGGSVITNTQATTATGLDANLGYWLDTCFDYGNSFEYDNDSTVAVAPTPGTPGTGVYFA